MQLVVPIAVMAAVAAATMIRRITSHTFFVFFIVFEFLSSLHALRERKVVFVVPVVFKNKSPVVFNRRGLGKCRCSTVIHHVICPFGQSGWHGACPYIVPLERGSEFFTLHSSLFP